MMANLFSMFDPSTSVFSMNWMIVVMPITVLVCTKSKQYKNKKMVASLSNWMEMEMSELMGTEKKMYSAQTSSLIFVVLAFMNVLALLSFNFAPSSHMSINLIVSLTLWVGTMVNAMKNSTKNLLAHMTPLGTPNMLMNFMVIIEIVSNIIRPMTLAIRLCANMVAGHLLMSLLSNFSMGFVSTIPLTSLTMMLFILLEMAVALIQAYVLSTLMTLYYSDSF